METTYCEGMSKHKYLSLQMGLLLSTVSSCCRDSAKWKSECSCLSSSNPGGSSNPQMEQMKPSIHNCWPGLLDEAVASWLINWPTSSRFSAFITWMKSKMHLLYSCMKAWKIELYSFLCYQIIENLFRQTFALVVTSSIFAPSKPSPITGLLKTASLL